MNSAVVEGMSEEHRGFFRDVWQFALTPEQREREAISRAARDLPGVTA